MRKVLLVCFDFPPNQGIGGRRWAKLARAMADRGIEVFVIKADPVVGNVTSPWTKDVEHPQIKITSLPRVYPTAVSHPKQGLLGKIAFRWHTARLRRMTRGTIYDVSVGWEKSFRHAAHSLVEKEKITHVMATGAPFHLLVEAARLKDRFPHLKVLCDYRDPWITGVNYGMPQLPPGRMQYEKDLQHEVFMKADIVTAVNPFMLDEIKQSDPLVSETKCRFEVLPHFYDRADVPESNKSVDKPSDGKIRLVYGGALYMGLEPFFEKINAWLNELKHDDKTLYDRLSIEIFTPDLRFQKFVADHETVIRIEKPIGKTLFQKVATADYAIVFSAHHNKDYLTTKFMEYLPLRKPLVHIGEEGFCRAFILDNRLGETWEGFAERLAKGELNAPETNMAYPAENHETQKVTEYLIQLPGL